MHSSPRLGKALLVCLTLRTAVPPPLLDLDEGFDVSHLETPFQSAMRSLEDAIERSRLVIDQLREVLDGDATTERRRQ
jgi:hypothetical protein